MVAKDQHMGRGEGRSVTAEVGPKPTDKPWDDDSRFVDDAVGWVIDTSQSEGEPFDFSLPDDDEEDAEREEA